MHRFDDDEAPASLQCGANVAKHRRVLGHLVIRVVDQNGIEPIDGKVWIVDPTDDDVDIGDVLSGSTITQLVEGGLSDVDGHRAAIRRDSACDRNRESAVASTNVGDERTRLRPERPDDIGDAILALELGTSGLSKSSARGAANQNAQGGPREPPGE